MGSVPPFLTRSRNSLASSMMVRSAPKSVSNTLSKPRRRSAATILPSHVGADGHSRSPRPGWRGRRARCCTTTCFFGIGQGGAAPRRCCPSRVRAPVGQTTMHWPQETQAVVAQVHLKGGADVGVEAAVVGADDADVLHALADGHAAAAEDALAVVADQMQAELVHLGLGHLAPSKRCSSSTPYSSAQLLQLAVAAAHAGQAAPCCGWRASAPGWSCGLRSTLGVLVKTSMPSLTG